MALIVRDLMITDPITVRNDATIGDAVELFANNDVGSLVVVNVEGEVVGFLSDGDIIEYVVRNVNKRNIAMSHVRSWEHIDCFNQYLGEAVDDKVYECATPHVISIESVATLKAASRLIKRKHLKNLPVIDDGKLVGLISRRMIIRGMFNDYLANPQAPCLDSKLEDY